MKKIIILAMVLLSVNVFADVNSNPKSNEVEIESNQVCITTKGVTGTLNVRSSNVSFENSNNFPVTVSWEVYGYNSNGRPIKVAGGDKALKPNGQGVSNVYGLDNVTNPYLEMTVWKCE